MNKNIVYALGINFLTLLGTFYGFADTWTDSATGYTWTYTVRGDTAEIFKSNFSAAISPRPKGNLTIPSRLGGNRVTSIGSYAFEKCIGLTSVTIPDSVTSIEWYAFSGCIGLTSVAIPNSVSIIGPYAFEECIGLTSVTIPNSMTSIGAYAFSGCTGLTSVMIPDRVTVIGDGAFCGCTGLTGVTLSDEVKSIGKYAFADCRGLTSMAIPDSVTSIGDGAFSGCNSLSAIIAGANNSKYKSVDGLLMDKDCLTLIIGVNGEVIIPSTVTSIEDYAFSARSGLTSVAIPNSVTSIGAYAFEFCSGLTNATMPDSVTSIGEGAFRYCNGLTSVTIPNNVNSIEDYAFCGCSGLTSVTIPNSVTSIGAYAFYGCSGLTNVCVSSGDTERVKELITGSGYGIDSIRFIEVSCIVFDPNGGSVDESSRFLTLGCEVCDLPTPTRTGYAFAGWWTSASGGTQIFDSTIVTGDVTYVAQWQINQYTVVFDANCGDGSVTNEQNYASDVVAPEVIREGYTFGGWTPAILATVPASNVTYTAQWRINQYEVAFDADGGALGESALPSVTNTQDYVSAIVAPTATREGYTFAGWQPDVDATVPASNVTYTAQWRVNQYEVVFDGNGGALGESALPRVVTSQDYGSTIVPPSASRTGCTFDGWTPDVDATVPARDVAYTAQWKVWDITVESADVKIKDLYPDDYGRITNIVIGAEIEILPSGFFDGCDSLESITFLSPETDIGDNDLRKVGRLFDVQPDGYWVVQGVLLGYKGECPGVIPNVDSIRRVIGDALEGCIALTDLTFTAESVVTSVGTNAFKGCTELRALTLPPSLEEIGDEAFMGCSYLDNVIVPGSVKRVGARAFKNCTGFTGALIEYGVESLGDEAFYGDWRISEVDIPSSVTNIGVSAFGGDSSIIRVGLRGDVRKVSEIFSNYAILREATVKEGDGAIVDGLFEGCAELADVHFLGSSPELANDGRNIYSGTPETLTTYVATTSTGWDGTKGSHSLPQAWPLAGNRRSIAQWDLPTYLVLFDSNGGTLGVQSTYQYSERKFTLPPEPVQTGYKFAGWWTKPVGGLRVTGDTVFIEGVYRTLYAHWTKGRWVFLDPNGGTVENEFVTYIEQTEYGVLPTPVRTGYAFDGWTYNGKTVLATDELLADEDHVLKADWRKNKYIVTFDANSGDGGGVYELEYDSEIVPPAVVREGYMFLGWSPEVAATVPASNVTYAAQWKLNEYRVSLFVGNGEEGSQLVVTHGAKVGDIALPTRDGYVFGGWYDKPEDGKLVDGDTLIVGDMSLYAKWNSIYTVVFDANGGEGVMPDQPFVYGKEQSLSNIVFKATDRRFAGWATEKDGIVEYDDGEVVSNLTEIANGVVTLFAVWEVWTDDMQTCDDAFGGNGVVSLDENDNVVVTLTNDVSGTVEIPDYVGAVTIDLNGHDIVGDGGPAIRVVKGDGEGDATRLAIVDTSEGEKGQILGGGESAGIEVAEDAATGLRLDVEEGVGVFSGDGSEQPWWELCPVEATLVAGEYFKMSLSELGFDVPTDGTPYSVVAKGLPAGLQLKYNAAVTKKVKQGKTTKTVVVKPAKSEWWIEGVPTAAVDFFTNPPYLVITANGETKTEALPVEVLAQNVTELEDLALGQTVNEQFYLPGVTNGWTVSGLPTGLKYTAKRITEKLESGKQTKTVTKALPYSVYGKTTKAGLFTITAKRKAGAFYETMKYRVLVKPAPVDTALVGEELANITTMAYVPVKWDLTGSVPSVPPVPFVPSSIGGNLAKVTGLPTGLSFAASDAYGYKNAKKKTGKYLKQKGQTIVGTPTKPGTYVVTFTKNVTTGTGKNKKTVAKTAQILWTVTANDANLELGFNTAGGVIEGGSVGLKYGDLMAFTATDGATVTASGMPAGITLANLGGGSYAFAGFTTKAGTYLVTVKATLNGKTVTQRVALKVDGLPSWARGTFNGAVTAPRRDEGIAPYQGDTTNGLATITVSSVGKISGKFQEGGTNWTFTAASYTGYDDAAPAYSVPVVAKYSYKEKEKVKVNGKWTTKTVTKYVTRDFTLKVGQDALGGMATLEEVDGSTVHAWQNLWGQADYKALGTRLFSTKSGKKTLAYRTFTIKGTDDVGAEMGLTDAMSLSLKVTTAGAVTATMSFDTGTKSKGKAVIYKPTCSTVVIPLSAADAEEFEGEVFLFFAPSSANGFPGFAGAAPL